MTREEWIHKLDELSGQAKSDGFDDLVAIFAAACLATIDGYAPAAAYVFADFVRNMTDRKSTKAASLEVH